MIASRPPYTLGWDFAGIVETAGDGVHDFGPGDAVVGMIDWLHDPGGTHADHAVAPVASIAFAPHGEATAEAATLPHRALTAAQALDLLAAARGQTIAVVGAAGPVGAFALELAVEAGVEVIGVASERDRAFIEARGARFIGRGERFVEQIRTLAPAGVDALFDTALVGEAALAAITDGGTYVGVVRPYLPSAQRGIRVDAVSVRSDGAQLADLVRLAEKGVLTLRTPRIFTLDEAAEAHRVVAEAGVRGGVVLTPSSN